MKQRMRSGWLAVLAGVIVSAVPGGAQEPAREPGLWLRLYETGVDMRFVPELVPGQLPNAVRVIRQVDLDEGDFKPCQDRFVSEVEGELVVSEPGLYRFSLLSDDGSRLWIDGQLVIDNDGQHASEAQHGQLWLTAGRHPLRIRHFDQWGGERLALMWIPPGSAPDADFQTVPAEAFVHDPSATTATAEGKKRIIPPLRRGLPGDGSPVAGLDPGFKIQSEPVPDDPKVPRLVPEALPVIGKPFTPAEVPVFAWMPPVDGRGIVGPIRPLVVTPTGSVLLARVDDDIYRIFGDLWEGLAGQGCVFRFAHDVGVDPHYLVPSGEVPFEMKSVRVRGKRIEIEFTQPLDPRVGWDTDSYYLEQWPFDLERGRTPTRDGTTTPVRSAGVTADRRKVLLEVGELKPPCVLYLRLLPPCFSEDGQRPWSTEAWYTLKELPPGELPPPPPAPPQPPQNVLTEEEKAAGWRLLFDGRTTRGWRGYRKAAFPKGWEIRRGCLVRVGPGGDIITEETFDDFELELEWRISPGGNSGIFYRVDESVGWPWETGPEMQVLDNAEHPDGRDPKTSAGANYALYAPVRDVTEPVGLFNRVRIVARGNHVEHWLNGVKVVEYELGSPDWQQRVAASKFAKWPRYGRIRKGHIVLQDHGDMVWYRNIKIRPLRAE